MLKSLALAGALAFALFVSPVVAQECTTVEDIQAMADGGGTTLDVLPNELVPGFFASLGLPVPEGTQRVVVSTGGPYGSAYGYEVDGCVTDPIYLGPSASA